METMWIAHPKLDSPPVEVPASALAQHQRAGWEQTEAPPPPPLPEPDPGPDDNPSEKTSGAPADAGASALQDASPSRRRTTTRGDE